LFKIHKFTTLVANLLQFMSLVLK